MQHGTRNYPGYSSVFEPSHDLSPAEVVLGEPDEFFLNAPTNNDINRRRNIIGNFAPCKQTYLSPAHRYVPLDLYSTKYVFIRTDAHTLPLTPPYPTLVPMK
ncbi:hypothetical protein Pcinc_000820 [Petrolisthes cinctipes]|uniref:Uncharacterized protein n=1 Tax=Petrolisthes cinctipes TaxID=88211 RepID=A0AAE1GMK3_PETCI|nr:hypothetical protein Pcinc_000812 [Petrolisthes cinctipes]KAK3895478.1 hypothetical protein Pcinc_000820 [Petrolisthes cinctipes]